MEIGIKIVVRRLLYIGSKLEHVSSYTIYFTKHNFFLPLSLEVASVLTLTTEGEQSVLHVFKQLWNRHFDAESTLYSVPI